MEFEPLFNSTVTEGPPESPCSASGVLVTTLTLCIASTEGTKVVYCWTQGLVALTPSMRTLGPWVPVPLAANCMDLEGLFVPPASCPPGGTTPGTRLSTPS